MSSSRRAPAAKRSAGARTPESKGAVRVRKAPDAAAPFRMQPSVQVVRRKVRLSGPRRLSEIPLDEDEVLVEGFDATLDGVKVRVTAVLERTCVYVDRTGDRRLASKKELWVDVAGLPIRRRGVG